MRHPSTRALFDYWSRVKGTRAAPTRGEIDPRALAPHLGDIFLLDSAEEAHALRLAGSRMEAELGGALVGRPFAALFDDACRREALQALTTATVEGEPVLVGVRLPQPATDSIDRRPDSGQWVRPHWANRRWPDLPRGQNERRSPRPGSGEMLLLPLTHRGRVGARVLGVFGLTSPSQALPAAPVSLQVTGERVLSAAALRAAGPRLSPGATLVARDGVVSLFRGTAFPPLPENDA